jgi:hypothetical protein
MYTTSEERTPTMTATQRTYRLTITTPEGQPLCTVLLSRERMELATPASAPVPGAAASTRRNGQESSDPEPRMTEPQKRYLFRLLAQQGIDGKAADGHLQQVFQVATLRAVSKTAASQLIEQLIANQQEGHHGHA